MKGYRGLVYIGISVRGSEVGLVVREAAIVGSGQCGIQRWKGWRGVAGKDGMCEPGMVGPRGCPVQGIVVYVIGW